MSCATCRWWVKDDGRELGALVLGERREQNEYYSWGDPQFEKRLAELSDTVRQCTHPKLLFYETPPADGAAIMDGSNYRGILMTGARFGCTNHEAQA